MWCKYNQTAHFFFAVPRRHLLLFLSTVGTRNGRSHFQECCFHRECFKESGNHIRKVTSQYRRACSNMV